MLAIYIYRLDFSSILPHSLVSTLSVDLSHNSTNIATTKSINMQQNSCDKSAVPPSGQDVHPWTYNDIEMVDADPIEPEATAVYTACHAAIDTVEILANIMIHLPKFQLFAIQRVSTKFHDTIEESPELQRKMMLKTPLHPAPTPDVWGSGITFRDMLIFNEVLGNTIFLPSIATQEGFTDGIHAMYGGSRHMHNKVAYHGELWFNRYREADFEMPEKSYCIDLANREASWRNMLISEQNLPPFRTRMHMEYRYIKQTSANDNTGLGRERVGYVTMGEVVDAVEKEYNEYWASQAKRWGIGVRKSVREADDWLDWKIGLRSRGLQLRV